MQRFLSREVNRELEHQKKKKKKKKKYVYKKGKQEAKNPMVRKSKSSTIHKDRHQSEDENRCDRRRSGIQSSIKLMHIRALEDSTVGANHNRRFFRVRP